MVEDPPSDGDGGTDQIDLLTPAFLKGHGSSSGGRKARIAETRLAKELGGRRYAASGSKAWDKDDATTMRGDFQTPDFHAEHKHTERDSLSVSRDWLRKVTAGSKRQLRDPMLVLQFRGEKECPEEWAVIPMETLQRLLKLAKG